MAKALRTVALVAGAIALVAATGGVFGLGLVVGSSIVAATTIATVAGIVAGVASLGAQLLTKPPPARGSITQVTVASDPPQPCLLGETYFGGVLRHDTGYGATLKKVPNPYRGMVIEYSGCGPVDALVEAQVDFTSIGAYYSGFLATASQLGATPESTALVPPLSAPMPGWSATSKLSGQAAILWNFKFDKEGKVFSSGLPVLGAVWRGVKVYDPRLDSTYPGGAGAQRIANEATWTWSANPALHALAYAYGRRQNGVLVFGVGLDVEAIRVADFVTLANVCDANAWRVSGVIQEPGDRWATLKEVLLAGGAEPVFAGGLLSLRVRTPQVALDTIVEDDLVGEAQVTAMQSYRDRLNTVIPKYRSPAHNWELVSATQVQVPTYLAEDGEEMTEELTYGLVRDATQATQLAAYRLVDGRELGPITLVCGPRLRAFRPGECLHLNLPALALDIDAVILTREIDPGAMTVTFTLIGESAAKHAYALGRVGTPPPTPALGQTAAQRDAIAAQTVLTAGSGAHRLISLNPLYPLTSNDVSITVAAFTGVTDDGRTIAFAAGSVTGLTASTAYNVFWNGAAYSAAVAPATAQMADSDLVFIGFQATDNGAGTYPGGSTPPGGWGGSGGGYVP